MFKFLERLLPHAPHRPQNANGRGPETIETLWPLAAQEAAPAAAMWPGQAAAFLVAESSSPLAQVPHISHRQAPDSYTQ